MQLGATVSLEDAIALGVTAAPIAAEKPLSDPELAELSRPYAKAGITPVQTNGYCNLVATDEAIRRENVAATRELLRKADLAGSRAVVVGGGHRDPAVPRDVFSAHPDNWKPEVIELLAQSCREIVDGLQLKTTRLSMETWVMTPLDSPKSVRRFLDLVGNKSVGILFDPVNMMNLDRHFRTGEFIAECFDAFGDDIVHVHAKDTKLIAAEFTYKMAEAPIGTGQLDYAELLRQMSRKAQDLPLVVEHLSKREDYAHAIAHIRGIARAEGLSFWAPAKA
jgi:L-ribulose-5-phosphate 3-epimerase